MSSETTKPSASDASDGPLLELERRLGADWKALRAARAKTAELRAQLSDALGHLEEQDCTVVVTGSLAREEAHAESDADWLLIVDGPSDPAHARMAREVDRAVRDLGFKEVGATRTFGVIVPSHALVHYIAGTRDTNENLTRRMLLLAESYAITGPLVRDRVVRNVLARYVELDRSVRRFHPIPHFLLNDVVRYWRTIASDYASKIWESDKDGWAARNIKLRCSRKLLFAWGLIASFSGELFPTDAMASRHDDDDAFYRLLADHIREQTNVTPLDLLARVASHESVANETKGRIFGAYDQFLGTMGDPEKRNHLRDVPFEEAADDPVYGELRTISQAFREGVNALFFDEHPQLRQLIRDYGVF